MLLVLINPLSVSNASSDEVLPLNIKRREAIRFYTFVRKLPAAPSIMDPLIGR